MTTVQRRSEYKKFFLYSLYGWGVPAVLTLIVYLAYVGTHTPYVIRPYIGTYKCYWNDRTGNYAKLLFYATPLMLMEMANLILYTKTVIYCLKVKGEIAKINDNNRKSTKERKRTFNADKEQLALILKLGITMGISFIFEVVSSMYSFGEHWLTENIEIVWDTFNCLQGVFIFIIFICKRKVYRLCRNKILTGRDRKISLSSLPTTQVSIPLTVSARS